MPRLLTDTQAADYPTLAGAVDRDELLADAGALYAWVHRHPFATEERLRARAEGDGITVDRANAALAFLREAGRLVTIPDGGLDDFGPVTIPRDLNEWTLDELQRLARLFDVEGRSSMSREELVVAIAALPTVNATAAAAEPVVTA